MLSKEIQYLLIEKEMKKSELAERCGWSPSNLYGKMKRDNFSEEELRLIADALDCELSIKFVPKVRE